MKASIFDLLILERRKDSKWGVINGGNAICAAIFETKKEAIEYRKNHACAYEVVPVSIIPNYEWIKRNKIKENKIPKSSAQFLKSI